MDGVGHGKNLERRGSGGASDRNEMVRRMLEAEKERERKKEEEEKMKKMEEENEKRWKNTK